MTRADLAVLMMPSRADGIAVPMKAFIPFCAASIQRHRVGSDIGTDGKTGLTQAGRVRAGPEAGSGSGLSSPIAAMRGRGDSLQAASGRLCDGIPSADQGCRGER
jgi:hypothetical protein